MIRSLRELRKFHWHQVLHNRNAANLAAAYFKSPGSAESFHRIADFHLCAVQLLNALPECAGTTAEQDSETDGN